MKMFKKRNLLVLMAVALTAFWSCNKDDSPSDPDNEPSTVTPETDSKEFTYSIVVDNSDDKREIVLDSLSSEIANIDISSDWIKVTQGESKNGRPVIVVSTTKTSDASDAVARITTVGGDMITVKIAAGTYSLGDTYEGANSNFVTDWENMTEIQLEGIPNPQKLPWVSDAKTIIPDDIRANYKKSQGWEMAFSYLNVSSLEKVRYFALYNKWTGILRVFNYVTDVSTTGNEFIYQVQMGAATKMNKYPFYHSLEYAVPSCHKPGASLMQYTNFSGTTRQSQSFESWYSPYVGILASTAVTEGWNCFDIDMSGFVPESVGDWKADNSETKLKILPVTNSTSNISLRGSLTGQLSGTFRNEQVIQKGGVNALSGFCSGLTTLSSMASSSIMSGNQYAKAMKNATGMSSWLTPTKYWGGFAFSIASGALSKLGELMEDPVDYDTVPGKIDLTLDATLELAGTIESASFNNIGMVNVASEAMVSANGIDGHLGTGVWGLAEDPVIYIDKQDLFSSDDRCRMVNRGSGVYSQTNFDTYNLRLVYFFDPTSVKVNINRKLFPDVKNVYVTTTCGVYPARQEGNTDIYRQFMKLGDRPTIDISNGKNVGQMVTLNNASAVKLIQCEPTDFVSKDAEAFENTSNCTLVTQQNGNIRFYGRQIEEFGKKIMVEPQVYVPYEKKDGTFFINNPKAPDFVVTVNIVFEACGSTFVYSKCFLPKIEMIDRATALKHYDRLKAYADKCDNEKPTATLANASDVNVFNPDGGRLLEKTLKVLGKLKGK